MRSAPFLVTAAAVSALVVTPASRATAAVTLDWSGFASAAYSYNFDQPADDTNHGRIFEALLRLVRRGSAFDQTRAVERRART